MPQAAAPAHELQTVVDELYERYVLLTDGHVATYIPELGNADPDKFGVCLVTADGRTFAAGDCDQPFTIQSISKPFAFGMAVEEFGHDKVLEYVGVEPSGDPFNSIELQTGSNRPHNPMINAGAITVSALLHAHHRGATLEHLLDRFSAIAGRRLTIDQNVYESERRTGHRNRAIAHLLLNFGLVHAEAEAALDLYFKQCSILVTCGMYDYSGQWAYRVGVPAKSGVSGGVMAVVNRQLGISTYSPRLDKYGNSCRGIEACSELASRLGLHVFDCLNIGSGFLDTIL
jgi:glutaminase